MAIRSNNPVFTRMEKEQVNYMDETQTASIKGVTTKMLLLVVLALAAGFAAPWIISDNPTVGIIIIITALFGQFIFVMIGMRSVRMAPAMTILYTITQGLFLGMLTWVADYYVRTELGQSGLALGAIIGTGAIFFTMLLLYRFNIIKVTARLQGIVMAALVAVVISFFIIMILSFTGLNLFGNWYFAVGMSVVLIVIGAICFALDFERAKQLADSNAPKAYEWQACLGLMVSLVFMYIQVLRLLILIAMRRD